MHFMVYVLVAPDVVNVESYVALVLDGSKAHPEITYPSFERPCYCVGWQASKDSFGVVDGSEQGRIWLTELKVARREQDSATEQRVLEERRHRAKEIERADPRCHQIDPECDTCHGTGKWLDTYDPYGCWDYWTIGGRYADRFPENRIPVHLLQPEDCTPSVIVTPDGYWHQSASHGGLPWPETPDDEAAWEEWEATFQALFDVHQNCLSIVVDCHN
jgi:hypothetical protein